MAKKTKEEKAITNLASASTGENSPEKTAYLGVIEKFKENNPEGYERQKEEIEKIISSL